MQRHAVPTKLRLNSILLGGLGIGHCAPVVLRVSLGLIKTLVSVADVTKPAAAKWATKSAKCRLLFFFFDQSIVLFDVCCAPHEINAAYSINKTSWDLYVWRRFKKKTRGQCRGMQRQQSSVWLMFCKAARRRTAHCLPVIGRLSRPTPQHHLRQHGNAPLLFGPLLSAEGASACMSDDLTKPL